MTWSSSSTAASSQSPPTVASVTRYLRELSRTGRTELLAASTDALLQALTAEHGNSQSSVRNAAADLFAYGDKFTEFANKQPVGNRRFDRDKFDELLADFEKAIERATGPSDSASSWTSSLDSGRFSDSTTATAAFQQPTTMKDADTLAIAQLDQNLAELMHQLRLRFEPVFAGFEDVDSDDDAVTVDEKKEEREEKHGQKLYEEEVEKLPDGREIRRKKTRTVSVKQSSKQVTISTSGGGCPTVRRTFVTPDDTEVHRDDWDDDDNDGNGGDRGNRRSPLSAMALSRLPRRFTDGFEDDNSTDGNSQTTSTTSDGGKTKTKTLQSTSEVIQSVAQRRARNGQVLANAEAQQVDASELLARSKEQWKGSELVERSGDGSYEESTTIRTGPRRRSDRDDEGGEEEAEEEGPNGRKQRHVVEFVKTFGTKRAGGDDHAAAAAATTTASATSNSSASAGDFLVGQALASYCLLNDNLRVHEEQFRRRLTFEFNNTGGSFVSADFSSLAELLQSANDVDRLKLPTKFVPDEQQQQQDSIGYVSRKAITDTDANVLESTDVSEYLVWKEMDGSPSSRQQPEVRGGPRDALIAYAAQAGSTLLFQEAFLATYRTFTDVLQLVQKLVKRYLYLSLNDARDSQRAARATFSTLVRVVDELCVSEVDEQLFGTLQCFVYRLLRDGHVTHARLLRKRLHERLDHHANLLKNHPYEPVPSISSLSQSDVAAPQALLSFKSSELAAQLTLIDAELFARIEPTELLWWSREQNEKRCAELAAFTRHFNRVSYWTRSLLVRPSSKRDRERFASKMVKMMRHLRQLGNFNSYLAVLSALDSGPVRRLDWPSWYVNALADHLPVMDSSHSFKCYRQLLAAQPPPCLPYIGLILQDLTFVHVGSADELPSEAVAGKKGLLNFGKRWRQFAILDSVRRFKNWSYTLKPSERAHQLLMDLTTNHVLSEDDAWACSERIKPRQSRTTTTTTTTTTNKPASGW